MPRGRGIANGADYRPAVVDPTGHDNDAAALAALDGVTLLESMVGRRKAIANSFGLGLSVGEYAPRDKGAAEMMRIVNAMYANVITLHGRHHAA
jgi:hypothetical protein